MTRSKAQREQDRADLLAVFADATEPMWTNDVIAAAYGLRPGQSPGYTAESRGRNDLAALERAGLVVADRGAWNHHCRWSLPTNDGALTRQELDDDVADLTRQMAGWEPVDEEAAP